VPADLLDHADQSVWPSYTSPTADADESVWPSYPDESEAVWPSYPDDSVWPSSRSDADAQPAGLLDDTDVGAWNPADLTREPASAELLDSLDAATPAAVELAAELDQADAAGPVLDDTDPVGLPPAALLDSAPPIPEATAVLAAAEATPAAPVAAPAVAEEDPNSTDAIWAVLFAPRRTEADHARLARAQSELDQARYGQTGSSPRLSSALAEATRSRQSWPAAPPATTRYSGRPQQQPPARPSILWLVAVLIVAVAVVLAVITLH
jgi:hypothetical protein